MDEAKMSDAKTNDVDLWLMDDRITYDPSLLEGLVVPKEIEEAFDKALEELAAEYAASAA